MRATGSDTHPAPSAAMRADARRNYERLLSAAAAAFAEHGADDVSLEEIAGAPVSGSARSTGTSPLAKRC